MIKNVMLTVGLIWSVSTFATPLSKEQKEKRRKTQITQFEDMRDEFVTGYAPLEYKDEEWRINFERNFTSSMDLIKNTPYDQLSGREIKSFYQKVVSRFFQSLNDYHVSVTFESSEQSRLPFRLRGTTINGVRKFFIINIDKIALGSIPLEIGDELIAIDGQSMVNVLEEMKTEIGNNDLKETSSLIAENAITWRRRARGLNTPYGKLKFEVNHKKNKTNRSVDSYSIDWNYSPNEFFLEVTRLSPTNIFKHDQFQMEISNPDRMLIAPRSNDKKDRMDEDNRHQIGGKLSYTPPMGKILWRSGEGNFFDAYLYEKTDGTIGGYIRINTYSPDDLIQSAQEFATIMKIFKRCANSLFIDQINNPGGSVIYLYTIVSMLSQGKNIQPPEHKLALNEAMAKEAAETLKVLERIPVGNDEISKQVLGEYLLTWKVNYQLVQDMIDAQRFILKEWKEISTANDDYVDRAITRPTHLTGPKIITPYWNEESLWRGGNPIISINGLDFSGGDFFPFIMASNKIGLLVGSATAGAGGYVLQGSDTSSTGIISWTRTGSLAQGFGGYPEIEGNGVAPHIEIVLTQNDFENAMEDYGKSLKSIDIEKNKPLNSDALPKDQIMKVIQNLNASPEQIERLKEEQRIPVLAMISLKQNAQNSLCSQLFPANVVLFRQGKNNL